jgi:hypothetical protein
MISLYKSTNVNNYVPFDIILAIAFPLLIYSSIDYPGQLAIFIFLTVTHIIMGILRYCFRKEVRWPVWADFIAIGAGALLVIFSTVPILWDNEIWATDWARIILYSLIGLFIIYGHGRKIAKPELPYYYGQEEKQEITENQQKIINF